MSAIDEAVMAFCARLPRGGFTLAKLARRVLPGLAAYPARLPFGDFALCGDVAQNVFYPLAAKGYYAHQVLEDDLLAGLAKAATVIVDVGANIGYTAALMATFAPPAARIIAFEPLPLCRPYLDQVAKRFPSVTVIGVAVGRAKGTAQFLQRTSSDRSSFAGKGEAAVTDTLQVEVTTLDAELRDASVDLIKIDVEGFEPAVLEGGRGVISRSRPIVVFEAYEAEVEELAVRFFRDLNAEYAIYAVNSGGVLRLLGKERGTAPDTCNFVAWPLCRNPPSNLEIPRCYQR